MTEKDDDRVPIAWGDVGAITLMAGVGVFTLWLIGDMVLGGHPLAMLFGGEQKQVYVPPTAEEIRNTPMHLDPGEVRIFLPEKPKKPPAKPKTQGNAEIPR
ncbi:MAG TPA: hypothetical protein VHE09_16990 [Rhizomicrobium sp.]|jgi:hypothetical protein|nr:hypothetical protein [Rhizomicrobium sp.]